VRTLHENHQERHKADAGRFGSIVCANVGNAQRKRIFASQSRLVKKDRQDAAGPKVFGKEYKDEGLNRESEVYMKSRKSAGISEADLQKIFKKIADLFNSDKPGDPGNPFYTKKDAITVLRPTIRAMMEFGWTQKQIAGFLTENGVECTAKSLSVFLDYAKYKKNEFLAKNDARAKVVA